MADMMTFPDTVEEFMEEYKLVDTEQVYTNGTELVPIFRMKQWFEHEKTQLSKEGTTSDLISRTATIDAVNNAFDRETLLTGFVRSIALRAIRDMPTVQPEPTDINAKEAVYNLAEKIGIHQLFALTVELRGEPIQPEPHEGHWIDKGWDGDWAWQIDGHGNCWRVIECSECGKGVSVESNYCPHCGARMKGDANGKGN